ncbi:ErfK/YbiS/YcfS/YnhG family protein [Thiorhodococcus drewsii AZ1]|uniref:ErfK/YbiS/YcfS/YnhG family protein n=1 Tax=Thiorhodococcus drewsii AZ1 TaxID=765913 RepID=G2E3B2_9GAMM|nr:L,D-transpeptidase [Thiorhodococcus drewsii]EGV30301.1 ErfK/YbiS/YcfS/YnhG family protein [Thiorhodococcus drewsii AZ1]
MPRCKVPLVVILLPLILAACAGAPERRAPERQPPKTAGQQTAQPAQDHQPSSPTDTTSEPAADPSTVKKRALVISLADQTFDYSEDGETVRTGPISSGADGYPTPTGQFAVLSKDEDKVSSRYTNQLGMQAWMPYAIQFHGNYFLHEGWLPGYPDSHGCVRVGEPDARFFFERLQIGDPVTVTR